MVIEFPLHIASQVLTSAFLEDRDIRLSILRLDAIHPLISGNKWFKLRPSIALARQAQKRALLTFGGAYSNHLLATAAAARDSGMDSIGLIRGVHGRDKQTATLRDCERLGMRLHFLSREAYAHKARSNFTEQLHTDFPHAWIIPEGGDDKHGREGASGIAALLEPHLDIVVLPVGTGTTFCGIRKALDLQTAVLGFAGFKNGEYLRDKIRNDLPPGMQNWELITEFHFGGFARHSPELIRFMNGFYEQYTLPLDFVYTAKMMFGLYARIKAGAFPRGSRICAVHTGGLQGNRSLDTLVF